MSFDGWTIQGLKSEPPRPCDDCGEDGWRVIEVEPFHETTRHPVPPRFPWTNAETGEVSVMCDQCRENAANGLWMA